MISDGSLVKRPITCSDISFRVGFVEAVATDAGYRRRATEQTSANDGDIMVLWAPESLELNLDRLIICDW